MNIILFMLIVVVFFVICIYCYKDIDVFIYLKKIFVLKFSGFLKCVDK